MIRIFDHNGLELADNGDQQSAVPHKMHVDFTDGFQADAGGCEDFKAVVTDLVTCSDLDKLFRRLKVTPSISDLYISPNVILQDWDTKKAFHEHVTNNTTLLRVSFKHYQLQRSNVKDSWECPPYTGEPEIFSAILERASGFFKALASTGKATAATVSQTVGRQFTNSHT